MDESNNVLVEDTENERTVAVYEWVEAAIFALVCVVLVFTFLFRIVGVDGESMQTTLMDHDRLILMYQYVRSASARCRTSLICLVKFPIFSFNR